MRTRAKRKTIFILEVLPMLQLRAPKKLMATIQTWVCVVLVVACVAFSFGPLFTLETIDNAKEIEDSINEVLGDGVEVEIPEKIEISSIKLIKSISLIVDVVKVSKEIAKAEEIRKEYFKFKKLRYGKDENLYT